MTTETVVVNGEDIVVVDSGSSVEIIEVGIQGPPGASDAAGILTLLLTVDGAGSGLDADTLDGLDSTAFALEVDLLADIAAANTFAVAMAAALG